MPCSAWLARCELPEGFDPWLSRIQNDLFDLGADLAVPEEERADRASERERTGSASSPSR